jgi:RNase P subunit RPR2
MIRKVRSSVRTNKLKCSNCDKPLLIGEQALFDLDDSRRKPMISVLCEECSYGVDSDDTHPFDLEGQA